MADPLFRKALGDLRGQILGWGIGIGLMLMLTVLLYPSIGSAYADVIDELPEGFLSFLGGATFDTLEGYLSIEFFSYAPLVLGIFAVMAGSASLVGEESQGTLDLLLAQPSGGGVWRWRSWQGSWSPQAFLPASSSPSSG